MNSVILSVLAVSVSLLVGVPAAYALARFKFRGKESLAFTFLSFRFAPEFAVIIPLSIIYRRLGIYNTYGGIVWVYQLITLPLLIWVLRGYFEEISPEIEQAAMTDGYSWWQVFIRILLPLVRPGLAASALLAFVFAWNNFVFPLVLGGSEVQTVTVSALSSCRLLRPFTTAWRPPRVGSPSPKSSRPEHPALPDPRLELRRRQGINHHSEDILMAKLLLDHVTKKFGSVTAVSDLSLEVANGEFLVLLGPSGAGKTTTLKLIAGVEHLTDGLIYIGDKLVNALEPPRRNVAMAFETYALYPNYNVYDNLAFPLRAPGRKIAKERDRPARSARG